MNSLKEYIVTLNNYEDLDEFYEEMEMLCHGKNEIPDRMVECYKRRTISRNTHYLLSSEEVDKLKKDSRVKSIIPHPKYLGIKAKPLNSQTSDYWSKSPNIEVNDINWGLLRCVNGAKINNWGTNGNTSVSGTINLTSSGKNVDVVIVDGFFEPDHPEFKKNPDGTGDSRFIPYNWFQHNPEVLVGSQISDYVYSPIIDPSEPIRTSDNNHGCHVAGTCVGNRQGWARDANIYNINPYSTDPNAVDTLDLIDYIREFHKNKPINPETGLKNPTITNHSWGFSYNDIAISRITLIQYKNELYYPPFSDRLIEKFGLVGTGVDQTGTIPVIKGIPANILTLNEDIQDAINEGIIFVGAAGNTSYKADVENGEDYNNLIVIDDLFLIFYNQGSSPASAPRVICVGSIAPTVEEFKSFFSISGPRIDIYSPGHNIMSAYNTNRSNFNDPRNSSYYLTKLSGTSMASPQVCGVLACVLEQYPELNQTEITDYLKHYAKKNQIENYSLLSGIYFGDNDVESITFGNDLFVMVGEEGQGSTSSSGLDWTALPAGNDTGMKFGGKTVLGNLLDEGFILDVSYVNDRFIAVGHSGKASYSFNGSDWISLPAGDNTGIKFGTPTGETALSNSGRSTTYGASTYVIVGSGGKASYSFNGVDWTSLPAGITTGIKFGTSIAHKVIYANNLFIAVGDSGKASYSSNGISWTSLTPGDNSGIRLGTSSAYSVAFGNNVFVVVGDSGKASYSLDGINWTSLPAGNDTGIKFGTTTANSVTFANDRFIVVGNSGKASYSLDGINWTSLPAGNDTGMRFGNDSLDTITSVAYGSGVYIAAGWRGKASYSFNGVDWVPFGNVIDKSHRSLEGSENNFLFYYKERKDTGNVFPKTNYKIRPTTGITYPRPRYKYRK
jgi:hypothetical protein